MVRDTVCRSSIRRGRAEYTTRSGLQFSTGMCLLTSCRHSSRLCLVRFGGAAISMPSFAEAATANRGAIASP
jgi:hypothetical protein